MGAYDRDQLVDAYQLHAEPQEQPTPRTPIDRLVERIISFGGKASDAKLSVAKLLFDTSELYKMFVLGTDFEQQPCPEEEPERKESDSAFEQAKALLADGVLVEEEVEATMEEEFGAFLSR